MLRRRDRRGGVRPARRARRPGRHRSGATGAAAAPAHPERPDGRPGVPAAEPGDPARGVRRGAGRRGGGPRGGAAPPSGPDASGGAGPGRARRGDRGARRRRCRRRQLDGPPSAGRAGDTAVRDGRRHPRLLPRLDRSACADHRVRARTVPGVCVGVPARERADERRVRRVRQARQRNPPAVPRRAAWAPPGPAPGTGHGARAPPAALPRAPLPSRRPGAAGRRRRREHQPVDRRGDLRRRRVRGAGRAGRTARSGRGRGPPGGDAPDVRAPPPPHHGDGPARRPAALPRCCGLGGSGAPVGLRRRRRSRPGARDGPAGGVRPGPEPVADAAELRRPGLGRRRAASPPPARPPPAPHGTGPARGPRTRP